jgi:uncharacterized protein YbcV (DUF1398 family)
MKRYKETLELFLNKIQKQRFTANYTHFLISNKSHFISHIISYLETHKYPTPNSYKISISQGHSWGTH